MMMSLSGSSDSRISSCAIDQVGDAVVDGRAQEDDAIVREARVRIPFHAAARRVLDEPRHRDVFVADAHASDSFSSVWALCGRYRSQLAVGDDFVDEAVVGGVDRAHDEVAVGVLLDPLDRLTGVERKDLVEQLAHAGDLTRLDLDVDRLTRRATVRLVDQHAGVREDEALARRARCEQHAPRPTRPDRCRSSARRA